MRPHPRPPTKPPSAGPSALLLGQGAIHQAVSRLLAGHMLLHIQDPQQLQFGITPPDCALVVYCADRWHPQLEHTINTYAFKSGIPWLRAHAEFGSGIVGPYVVAGTAGCLSCAESRRRAPLPNAADALALIECVRVSESPLSQPWLTSLSVQVLAQLVVQEVTASLRSPRKVRSSNALLYVALDTLRISRHRFLPDPLCPDCGGRLDDTPEAAAFTLRSCPKLAPDIYRVRSLASIAEQLLDTYADAHTGLIHAMTKDPDTPGATVVASMGMDFGDWQHQFVGIGRTLRYQASMVAAIAEALERYGGQFPKGKRTVVHASYAELGDAAINPESLGLHTPEQYAQPGFEFVPFTRDTACNWVWAYSFQRQRPILVPERYAYYGMPTERANSHNPAFAYEISNGCALGNCLEEAIFYGMLELAERDAFLMTWYARLGIPRLDPFSVHDPTVRFLADEIAYTSGYTLHAYDATLDHAVPCFWVMAVDETNRPSMPKVLCSAGSHPHPEQALANALEELAVSVVHAPAHFAREEERARARTMLADPDAVKEMEDHSLLYYLPEAFERFSFLFAQQPLQTFGERFGQHYHRPPTLDLRNDLAALVDHYLTRGIDVIVVDQTSAEHQAQDFHCVKVIMPGLLPMTFGHRHRRTIGFTRLAQLPCALGYWAHRVSDADINPFPHPFP